VIHHIVIIVVAAPIIGLAVYFGLLIPLAIWKATIGWLPPWLERLYFDD
jgi:hypothetical protein